MTTIGKSTTGASVPINVERLIETRMLVTSRSGGGKSWALRRLLEQTHGQVQQIVIDVEDEFYCVIPSTPILLSTGELIEAKDLRTGHEVVSLDEHTGTYVYAPVVAVSRQQVPETWTLSATLSRTITGTANHLLLAKHSKGSRCFGWVALGQLRAGDYIAIPDSLPDPEPCKWEWIAPRWMKQDGNTLRYMERQAKQITLPDLSDPRLFRFLGYLLADGHISKDLRSVMFVDGKRASRDTFSDLARDLFGVSAQPKDYPRKFEAWMRNKTLGVFLESLGCQRGRKAARLQFPPLVMQSTNAQASDFLQAYRECDGHKKTIATSSAIAASQLAYLIERTTDCHAAIYRKTHKKAFIQNAICFEVNQISESRQSGFSCKYALGSAERRSGKTGRIPGLHWVKVKRNIRNAQPTEVVGCYVPPFNNLILGTVPLISHNTLRERFDYVLAGRQGGDCPADPRCAALLARKLLELRVSAIIGIYELKAHERVQFVRLFLESLVDSPKELWHPALIVIDEAHIFAPESAKCESKQAVVDLMTRGRKRGFCGILASQRISNLDKNASAQAVNKLVGGFSQDIDVKRSADDLGFYRREQQAELRSLRPGSFFAIGPALCEQVTEVIVGPVTTTHPRAGQRAMAPPPPAESVRRVLAQLADLPHEAEREAATIAELQKQIRELRTRTITPEQRAEIENRVKAQYEGEIRALRTAIQRGREILLAAGGEASAPMPSMGRFVRPVPPPHSEIATIALPLRAPDSNGASRDDSADSLGKGERAIMIAIAQYGNITNSHIAILTGYKDTSRRTYLQRLKQRGYIDDANGAITPTSAGLAALGEYERLPAGSALRSYWLTNLPEGERRLFSVLCGSATGTPRAFSRDELEGVTGYKATSVRTYCQRLGARKLIVDAGRGQVKASEELFT